MQYVYGIVEAGAELPAAELPGAELPGTDGLRLTNSGRVAAVHTAMQPAELEGIEQDLSESGRLAVLARRHDEVVRGLAQTGTVLPVRLGTAFPDEAAIAAVLADAESSLAAELDRVRDRHEWSLRVRAARSATADAPSGTAYLMARRDEARARNSLRDALSSVDQTLAGLAEAATGQGPAATGMSRSYLVPDTTVAEFTAAAATAVSELETYGCTAWLSGPLPPYSFVAVRLEVRSLA